MALKDARGNLLGTDSAAARDAAETALWRMMSFYDTPLDDLDARDRGRPALAAAARDEGRLPAEPDRAVDGAEARAPSGARRALLAARADARARAPARPRSACCDGRWHDACRAVGRVAARAPARRARAAVGAPVGLLPRRRAQPARSARRACCPSGTRPIRCIPYVLGLHAFGLEENNLLRRRPKRPAGARSRATPRVPWAIHAVAHVMEMQGRFDEGAAWLRQHQRQWAEGNGFAGHLWWHLALFRLEGLDDAGALRLVDAHLAATRCRSRCSASTPRRCCGGCTCSASTSARAAQRAGCAAGTWPTTAPATTPSTTCTRCWRCSAPATAAARRAWVARCADARAGAETRGAATTRWRARSALPLMRGLLAFARGDFDAAVAALYPAARAGAALRRQPRAARPDRPDAAGRRRGAASRRRLGRALLNERRAGQAGDAVDRATGPSGSAAAAEPQ